MWSAHFYRFTSTHLYETETETEIPQQEDPNRPWKIAGIIQDSCPLSPQAKTIWAPISCTLQATHKKKKAYTRAKIIPATQSNVFEITDCPLEEYTAFTMPKLRSEHVVNRWYPVSSTPKGGRRFCLLPFLISSELSLGEYERQRASWNTSHMED